MTYMYRMDGDLNLEVVLLKRHDQWMKDIVSEFSNFLLYFSFHFLSFQTHAHKSTLALHLPAGYHTMPTVVMKTYTVHILISSHI